jgi:hypothetical protein
MDNTTWRDPLKQLNLERLEQLQLGLEVTAGITFVMVWFTPILTWFACGPIACAILFGFEMIQRDAMPASFRSRLVLVGIALTVIIAIAVTRVL